MRAVGLKLVSANEPYFAGHFPQTPVLPGVLLCEALAQLAGILVADEDGLRLVGVERARFRRPVLPGDHLQLEVTSVDPGPPRRLQGRARVGDVLVAEVDFSAAAGTGPRIHPTAVVDRRAELDSGVVVGPYAVVGGDVRVGSDSWIGAHVVLTGRTTLGQRNRIFSFASVGAVPQDLKYRGEPTRLVVGHHNVFREFVTIHRGTDGGGGITTIGHHNLFMAYAHVAHDCHVGNHTIFGNGATLGGHVTVEDYATVSAFSGVHQFCRVGRHAFIGGFSVITKDALPYAKTVGNRARIYGLNTIGLVRRKFSSDSITKLRRAYRHLLHSNTSRALAQIERDPTLKCDEVQYLVDFIRTSSRGVGLRRPSRRLEEVADE